MRAKQALSGPFVRARVALGRLEVEGTWQKDSKRRLILRLDAKNVETLERAIATFKTANQNEPVEPPSAAEIRALRAEERAKGKTFKTIGDV